MDINLMTSSPTDGTQKRNAFIDQFSAGARKLDILAGYTHPKNRRLMRQAIGMKLFGPAYFYFILARMGCLPAFELHPTLFWGKKIVLPADRVGTEINYLGAVPEPSLIAFLAKSIRENEVFYDIGANYGFYTMLAAEFVDKRGEIHAFEPGDIPFSYLEKNTKDIALPPIYREHRALAAESGDITFFNVSGMHSQSTAVASVISSGQLPHHTTTVSAMALDDYLVGHHPPTLIKMDVEGYEADVLRGAEKLLRQHSPTIVMEVWGGDRGKEFSSAAVSLLYDAGYRAHEIAPDGDTRDIGRVDLPSRTLGDNFVFRK